MNDTELDSLLRRQRIDILAHKANLTTGYQAPFGAQQAADCFQRCAFASTIGAEQRDHAALRYIDRNALDGERHVVVDDLDIVE
jgi:hypothetical protein